MAGGIAIDAAKKNSLTKEIFIHNLRYPADFYSPLDYATKFYLTFQCGANGNYFVGHAQDA